MTEIEVDNNYQEYQNRESAKINKILSRKVNALKNIHVKIINIEERFYDELHQLECKYAKYYEPLFDQREKIITGEYEPTDEEALWPFDDNDDDQEKSEQKDDSGNGNDVKDLAKDLESIKMDDIVGIPCFWLQAFKRTDLINDMIQEHDEQVLQHLRDIKLVMYEKKPYGYTLEFHFGENEFFTNKVLTKTYELTCDMDDKDPFSYDGPVMYRCKGCIIDWNKGKDVTVKTIKKKQKHKSSGTIRVILKEEKQDSFFNYFDTPTHDGFRPSYRSSSLAAKNQNAAAAAAVADDEEEDDIAEDLCNADFEIGHFFKEFIIPKAVLYYTGDLLDQASYNGEDELDDFFPEDEEGCDDDDDDEAECDLEQDESKNQQNKSKNKSLNLSKTSKSQA